jgi:Protein of unknown function (DUF3500)
MTSMIAGQMAEAAAALLKSLDDMQRKIACRPFPDDAERKRWFYTPTDHGGLPLTAMMSVQHRLVHKLVASGLSEAGYVTMAAIMGLENILDHHEGWGVDFGRDRGRDPLLYYVTIFGEPGSGAWAWRFGGHHVSLHHTILNGEVVASTPNFFGADPADTPLLGPHLHRPLAAVEDLGRELFRSFDGVKRSQALVAKVAPTDLISGNRPSIAVGDGLLPVAAIWRQKFEGATGKQFEERQRKAEQTLGLEASHLDALSLTADPKGIRTGDMAPAETEILRALLGCYLNRLPDALADRQLALAEREFDQLAFAWAGGDERYQPHYYRIQGERLFIEYDNTQRGANHIHAVWRDLANDFGGDVLARHYAEQSH